MTAIGRCSLCHPSVLFPEVAPPHCYGTADSPAPKGVLGGFRCSCECLSGGSVAARERYEKVNTSTADDCYAGQMAGMVLAYRDALAIIEAKGTP